MLLKVAASDETSEKRSGRHVLIGNRHEITQELHKPMHFWIFRTILRNSHQDTFRIRPDDRKFHNIGRIEQHIRTLLVRIYPLHLRTTHIRPVHYRLTGWECAFVEVTADSAYQSVIACRDTVVVIERYAWQATSVVYLWNAIPCQRKSHNRHRAILLRCFPSISSAVYPEMNWEVDPARGQVCIPDNWPDRFLSEKQNGYTLFTLSPG